MSLDNPMYTLFNRGEEVVGCDDLPLLERGLQTLESTRGTYIRYNETGINHYEEDENEGNRD